ncbi:outer membrane beta-barrel protein, partial [Bacteroidota bacterium]
NADFMDLNTNKSIGFNLNMGEKNFGLVRNYIGIVTGWGLEFNHYSFSDGVTLSNVNNKTIATIDNSIDYKKNRLGTLYLTIPLLMEFQIPVSGEHKRIYVSAGVVGGVRLISRNVQKYKVSGDKVKNKIKDDFNLEGFRYGLTARIGYGDFGAFATYSLTPLFKENRGPELYPFTFGVTFAH